MNKKIILLVASLPVIAILVAIYLFINAQQTTSDEIFLNYTNEGDGYSIQYPESWTVDETHTYSMNETLYAPADDAEVFIEVHDGAATALDDPEIVFKAIHERMTWRTGHTVKRFKILDDETYRMSGTFDNNVEIWTFSEIGRVHEDGRLFILRANILKSSSRAYKQTIDQIFSSFKAFPESTAGSDCSVDSECKLLLSNCGCEAVLQSDSRKSLRIPNDDNIVCATNDCWNEGAEAVCLRGDCRVYIPGYDYK